MRVNMRLEPSLVLRVLRKYPSLAEFLEAKDREERAR